jgi:hypothetical protein
MRKGIWPGDSPGNLVANTTGVRVVLMKVCVGRNVPPGEKEAAAAACIISLKTTLLQPYYLTKAGGHDLNNVWLRS